MWQRLRKGKSGEYVMLTRRAGMEQEKSGAETPLFLWKINSLISRSTVDCGSPCLGQHRSLFILALFATKQEKAFLFKSCLIKLAHEEKLFALRTRHNPCICLWIIKTIYAHDGAFMPPEAITASITWRIVHNLFLWIVSRDWLANIGGGGGSWAHDLSTAFEKWTVLWCCLL